MARGPESYRHRITIQSPPSTQDSFGDTEPAAQEDANWTTEATRWASVEPMTGREYLTALQQGAEVTHTVRMRYLAGCEPKWRVKWGSRRFDVLSVQNIQETRWETRLMCKELLP